MNIKPFVKHQKAWQRGIITSKLDERSYEVATPTATIRRNRIYLRRINSENQVDSPNSSVPNNNIIVPNCDNSNSSPEQDCDQPIAPPEQPNTSSDEHSANQDTATNNSGDKVSRSGRRLKKPAKFDNFIQY